MDLKELQDAAARLFEGRSDVKEVSLSETLDIVDGKRVVTMKVYFPSASGSEWSIATQLDTSAESPEAALRLAWNELSEATNDAFSFYLGWLP